MRELENKFSNVNNEDLNSVLSECMNYKVNNLIRFLLLKL